MRTSLPINIDTLPRNRRIGELLKELDLTEGRSTGVPKPLHAMNANGSPLPEFESDEDRTYFLIRLPVNEAVGPETHVTGQVTGQVTGEVTPHVTPHVERMIMVLDRAMLRPEIMAALGMRARMHFLNNYIRPALAHGLIEMTDPNSRRSRQQRYRLTRFGKAFQAELATRRGTNPEEQGE